MARGKSKGKRKIIIPTGRRAILQKVLEEKYRNWTYNSYLKNNLSTNDIEIALKSLPKNILEEIFFENPLPKAINKLKQNFWFDNNGSLSKELSWYSIVINKYAEELNRFTLLKKIYEQCFMRGEFENCSKLISEVETDICFSIWGLENKFLIEEYTGGLENNKRLLGEINKSESHTYVLHLAQHLSTKAEREMSVQNYNRKIDIYLDLYEDDNKQNKEYFKFKLDRFKNRYPDNDLYILQVERNSSIIDRYLTFKDIVENQYLINSETFGNVPDISTEKFLKTFNLNVQDLLADKLQSIPKNKIPSNKSSVNIDFISACDRYTSGEYEKCVEMCACLLRKYPCSLELYDLICKSLIRCNKTVEDIEIFNSGSPGDIILRSVFDVLEKGKNTKSGFMSLLKQCYQLSSFDISSQIYAFILEESGSTATKIEQTRALLRSQIENVKDCFLYNNQQSISFLDLLHEKYPASSTVTFWGILQKTVGSDCELEKLNDLVPRERMLIYSAKIKKESGDIDGAINIYENMINDESAGYIDLPKFKYEQIVANLIECYLDNKLYDSAMDLAVRSYLSSEILSIMTNITHLVDLIRKNEIIIDKSNVCYPILFDISQQDLKVKYVAYDNYLLSQCVDKPSQLIATYGDSIESNTCYFLSNICTPDILYKSIFFKGTDDIENERMAILQFLSRKDSKNVSIYKSEINEITKKSIIRKRIQELDESKIYIDLDGLKIAVQESVVNRH